MTIRKDSFSMSAAKKRRFVPRAVAWVLMALVLFCSGCGKGAPKDESRAEVSGIVTFDGKPLPAANLTFKAKDSPLAGQASIKADGRYSSGSIPIGKNMVGIATDSIRFGSPALYVKIPAKYEDYATSGLEVEIKPGVNENVNFDLKP